MALIRKSQPISLIIQGQRGTLTFFDAESWQGRQAGSVGGADPRHRRPRPHRRDHRCRPAAARRRQHHGRARAGHHPASGTVLRWGCGDHRIRSARPGQVPCLARTRRAQAGGARSPHQQRERLPRPAEGVDAALPWRRHQEPPELSELAANDRGPLNRLGPGRLDHGRRRIGSISTELDIRAKKKGLCMGGLPSLGYDVKDRKLVVNEAEAETVRMIFRRYLDLGSVRELKASLDAEGVVSKRRTAADGSPYGGHAFSRGPLYQMLQNRVYRGEIVHKGAAYPSEHPPIVDEDLWLRVQQKLEANGVEQRTGREEAR